MKQKKNIEPYVKHHYDDVWTLITDLKTALDNGGHVTMYHSNVKNFIRWKCQTSRQSFQIKDHTYFYSKNVPDIFVNNFPSTNMTISWIKSNSKAIDTVNNLKAFL